MTAKTEPARKRKITTPRWVNVYINADNGKPEVGGWWPSKLQADTNIKTEARNRRIACLKVSTVVEMEE